jgi:hypothetical protein
MADDCVLEASPITSSPASSPKSSVPPLVSRIGARCFTFPVVIAAVFAWVIFTLIPQSLADPDIWWHLRNAQYQLQTHSFIQRDMYSFTARGAPWMDHEWLAEIPFYLGWRAMGDRGVYLVMAAAILTVLLGVFYLAYRRSQNLGATILVSIVAALLATVSFGPRTLLFGWILLILELIVLERFRVKQSYAWALPMLFAVWVNTHGSWVIGLTLLGTFIVCGSIRLSMGAIENERWTRTQLRTLIAATCASFGALFANPYGWRLVAYPFNLAFHQKLNIANVEEWKTLDFHLMRGKVLLVALAALFLLQLIRRRRWALYELAFLFIGVYSAFTYSRFCFLAGILAMPLLAQDIPSLGPARNDPNRPLLNFALLIAVAGLFVLQFPKKLQPLDAGAAKFPVKALPFLRAFHPEGNFFADYLWGGWFIWNVPQIPDMLDSRVDIFEYNGTFKDYLDLIQLRNTLGILDKYHIRYVFFAKDSPVAYLLTQTHAWKVDYQDDTAVLFERISPTP